MYYGLEEFGHFQIYFLIKDSDKLFKKYEKVGAFTYKMQDVYYLVMG